MVINADPTHLRICIRRRRIRRWIRGLRGVAGCVGIAGGVGRRRLFGGLGQEILSIENGEIEQKKWIYPAKGWFLHIFTSWKMDENGVKGAKSVDLPSKRWEDTVTMKKMGFKQQTQVHSARIGIGQTAGFFRSFQAASTRLGYLGPPICIR